MTGRDIILVRKSGNLLNAQKYFSKPSGMNSASEFSLEECVLMARARKPFSPSEHVLPKQAAFLKSLIIASFL